MFKAAEDPNGPQPQVILAEEVPADHDLDVRWAAISKDVYRSVWPRWHDRRVCLDSKSSGQMKAALAVLSA